MSGSREKVVLPMTLAVKLASIAVHADEMTSPHGLELDALVLRGLIGDPQVVEWVNEMTREGLAPVKRGGGP